MKQADKSYTFDNLLEDLAKLQEEYYRQAVGPAKWEVYNEKRAFIKAQEDGFKVLRGFKQKAFDEAQRAADAKAEAAKLQESVLTLQTQAKNDAEMNRKRLQELEEHHKEEMKKFQEDEKERMEKERQRTEDFMKAQMEQMADLSKENSKQMKEQYDEAMKMMKLMTDQNERSMDALESSTKNFAKAIQNMRKLHVLMIGDN